MGRRAVKEAREAQKAVFDDVLRKTRATGAEHAVHLMQDETALDSDMARDTCLVDEGKGSLCICCWTNFWSAFRGADAGQG